MKRELRLFWRAAQPTLLGTAAFYLFWLGVERGIDSWLGVLFIATAVDMTREVFWGLRRRGL